MYANLDSRRPLTLIEGWLEHMTQQEKSWKRYWCVLTDGIIYFFNNQRTPNESPVREIALGPEARLENLDGDERFGYKFHLRTKRNLDIFKATKFTDREHWKAYIEGIAAGKVSDAIDLLPGQIEEIKNSLKHFLLTRPQTTSFQPPAPTASNLKSNSPNSSTSGSFVPKQDSEYLVPSQQRHLTTHKYKFYSDPLKTDIPSWFFSTCSRELAMQILTACSAHGNTLLRESTNETKNLVISKRMELGSGQDFTHYILQQTSQGYKIDVENPHEPMQTLSEVMEFFVETSGKTTTRPMKCNDLNILGFYDSVYNKRIVTTLQDADSGEESKSPASQEENESEKQEMFESCKFPVFSGLSGVADADANGLGLPLTKRGPPDIIAPPLPHIYKKDTKQYQSMGPRDQWNMRSTSVPNIHHKELEARLSKVSVLPGGSQTSHVMRTNSIEKHEGSEDKSDRSYNTYSKGSRPFKGTGVAVDEVPPPLPFNHPPPLKKANSQSGIQIPPGNPSFSVKKIGSQHTQSMGSADIQIRKLSPRDKNSAALAKDELLQDPVTFNKQKETQAASSRHTESAKIPGLVEEDVTPPLATESFKKRLADILVNPLPTGLRSRPQNICTSPSDNYEDINPYQNAQAIQTARK